MFAVMLPYGGEIDISVADVDLAELESETARRLERNCAMRAAWAGLCAQYGLGEEWGVARDPEAAFRAAYLHNRVRTFVGGADSTDAELAGFLDAPCLVHDLTMVDGVCLAVCTFATGEDAQGQPRSRTIPGIPLHWLSGSALSAFDPGTPVDQGRMPELPGQPLQSGDA